MASLSLKHIFKVYDGDVKAVNDFSMDIKDHEFIVFVGPSGCGKSTTLRMIAGLEDITAGELRIDDEIVNDYEPKDRNIAMVFQNYALYPHMTVYENMAFSLRTAHVPNEIIYEKVTEAAEILGITEYLDRKPKALSGGQRQRVALGRALVRSPKVFLLDEPLSNLDAKLRTQMRTEISRLHERLNSTFIYVTHDQVEAMTMGTRIVVMKDGYIQQIDTPINLYKYPDNMFVAGFIGTPQMNFFDATIIKNKDEVTYNFTFGSSITMKYIYTNKVPLKYMDGNHKVIFGIRPDDVRVKQNKNIDNDKWASLKAVVSVVEVLGGETIIYGNLNLNTPDVKEGSIIIKAEPDVFVKRGDIIDIELSITKFHVFDKETENSLRKRIPEENIIKCNIKDNVLSFGGQSFNLPNAIKVGNLSNTELVIPISAVTLGKGFAKAKIELIEQVDDTILYFLKVGNITFFAKEEKHQRFNIDDEVLFDIDFSQITINEALIKPLNLTNRLEGTFIKEKVSKNEYNFYLKIGKYKLIPSRRICEKLFACKGTKIFNTALIYEFNAKDLNISKESGKNRLSGKIIEVLDYGMKKYSKVDIGSNTVIVKYNGTINEIIELDIDVDKITIIDKFIDIIIV